MYKKKKNIWNIIFIILFIIVFVSLFLLIIFSKKLDYIKKLELGIELGGMFFTSFALILTYNSFKNEKEQKHLSNQPYLILNDIDFAIETVNKDEKQLDFDFSIVNKGNGIANKITVKVLKNNNELLFSKNYPKLDIIDNNIAPLLASIRDEINKLNNNTTLRYAPYFNESISDEFYIKNYIDENTYKSLIVEIIYYDIYGKKYKGIFNVELDEHFDMEDYTEELTEY